MKITRACAGCEFKRHVATIAVGQNDIGENQLHRLWLRAKGFNSLGCISRLQHTVALGTQDFTSHVADEGFVFHQQDGCSLLTEFTR